MKSLVQRSWLAGLLLVAVAAPCWAQSSRANEERREQWQRVPDIFNALLVRPGAVVADVGAGDGFFTSRLANAVGPDGRVLAVDVADDALRRLRQRVEAEALTNVEVIRGEVDDPKLPEGAVDAILIVNAYHEMTEYAAMLARMRAALKPGGRLVIVEPISERRRDRPRAEQTRNHEIAVSLVQEEVKAAGFTVVTMQDPFYTRPHGDHDAEFWMLVATPATPQTLAMARWSETRRGDWQSPGLRMSIDEFKALATSRDVLVIDARDEEMYRAGHLPGAVLMLVEDMVMPEALAKLKAEPRPIVAYCT